MQTRAPLWLRIAAVLAALYAVGHSIGRPWTATQDVMAQGVVVAMRGVHFTAAGMTRSYWDFYQGFGLAIGALLAVQAVLIWQLAALALARGPYRAMTVTHLVGFVLLAAVGGAYIFPLPMWLALAVAGCLIAALLRPLRT